MKLLNNIRKYIAKLFGFGCLKCPYCKSMNYTYHYLINDYDCKKCKIKYFNGYSWIKFFLLDKNYESLTVDYSNMKTYLTPHNISKPSLVINRIFDIDITPQNASEVAKKIQKLYLFS